MKFTCLTCQVGFSGLEQQKIHYASDWHTYNLKRKIALLPPVDADTFYQKVTAIQETLPETNYHCDTCNKRYATDNAYQNHLLSKKHQIALQNPKPEKQDTGSIQELSLSSQHVTYTDIQLSAEKDCIFCTHASDSLEENVRHMTEIHSLFIADLEYLRDLKGLIQYLLDKVSLGHYCLTCSEKGRRFLSVEAVRKHMSDKGHEKINYDDDGDLEIAEFYDFADLYVEEDDEWEDEEVLDIGRPVLPQGQIIEDDTQMVLPTGRVAGHRAFAKYWNQNLKPSESREAILINRLFGQYRTIGWHTTSEDVRAKMKQARLQTKAKSIHETRIGIKANGLMRYFRLQNPM